MLIGRGVSQKSVMTIAQELLVKFGSIRTVSEATLEELSQIKGIGFAKAAQIKACFELGKRQELEPILLNTRNKIIGISTVSIGALDSNLVHQREVIERRIYLIRNQKVMLSLHLADLYGVETRVLNQAVKRNIHRFPEDFMFQINASEAEQLVSQNVIPHKKYFGGSLPYAFTEQGVAMLSSILKSEQSIKINIAIMRAFVNLREILSTHKELAHKLAELERKIERHYEEIKVIFDAIRRLMAPPEPREKKIGFRVKERGASYRASRHGNTR